MKSFGPEKSPDGWIGGVAPGPLTYAQCAKVGAGRETIAKHLGGGFGAQHSASISIRKPNVRVFAA